ncbi:MULTISPECIES: hypothetical protein [unclassified Streptomyces]|uniref:hypothetical protein n=1 Tax=unclassified Streptomyces TaxID=2593676 RepID=UPI003821198A
MAHLLDDPVVDGPRAAAFGPGDAQPATRSTALPQGGRIPEHGPEFGPAGPGIRTPRSRARRTWLIIAARTHAPA